MAEPHDAAGAPDRGLSSWLAEVYNRETGEILGRTPRLWLYVFLYTLMFLLLLVAVTLLLLYVALKVVAARSAGLPSRVESLSTARDSRGVGLSTAPFLQGSNSISYTDGDASSYRGYVEALDEVMAAYRRARDVGPLGPCAARPYGYGKQPCVFVKVNKRVEWRGTPVGNVSGDPELDRWGRSGGKIWVRCVGRDPWDREHLQLAQHPDPPGLEPGWFPVNMSLPAPMLAVQVLRFTVGAALTVVCSLYSAEATGSVSFDLVVSPQQDN